MYVYVSMFVYMFVRVCVVCLCMNVACLCVACLCVCVWGTSCVLVYSDFFFIPMKEYPAGPSLPIKQEIVSGPELASAVQS